MPSCLPRLILALWAIVFLPLAAAAQDPWFEVDALNPVLGAAPETLDRRTPRATVEALLTAEDSNDFGTAIHLLDLTGEPAVAGPGDAEILARQLASVLDRTASLDWRMLNARPDGLQTTGGSRAAQAGEARRSLLIRELDLGPVPAAIRLERVKPGGAADPVWVFSRETVADIPALYRQFGPSTLEGMLPDSLRRDAVWGLMWWELLGLPLLIIVAVSVGITVRAGLRVLGRRAERDLSRRLLHAVSTPAIIAAVTTLVWWVTRDVFVFSGLIDVWLAPLIAIGFVTALLMLIVNLVDASIDHLIAPGDDVDLTSSDRDDQRALATKLNAAKRIVLIAVILVGVGIVLTSAEAFRSIGLSILASAGALTLILGFAARQVLGNVMASLQIALNQSARVGDRVVFKGELCHVERIHMTYVQLRDWDNTRVVVPVSEFVSETFENWTIVQPDMLRILKLKLDHAADIPKVREAFLQVIKDVDADPDLTNDLGPVSDASIKVAGQDVFGLDVWCSVPCTDPNTSWEVACTVRERLCARIAEIEAADDIRIFPEAAAAEAA